MGDISKSSSVGFLDFLPEHVWGEIFRHLGNDAPSKKAFLQVHPRICNSRWVHGQFSNLTVQLPEPEATPPTSAAMPASRSGPAAAASKSAMQTDPALLQPPPATLTITAASKDASFDAAAQSQSPLPAEFDWMGWLPRLSRLDVHIKRLIIRGSRTEKEPPFDEDLLELEQGLQLMHLMQQHDTAGMESDGPSLLMLLCPQQQSHAAMLLGLQAICFHGCKVPSLDAANRIGTALHAHCRNLRCLHWDGFGVWCPLIEGLVECVSRGPCGSPAPLLLERLELAGIDRLDEANIHSILKIQGLQALSLPDSCMPYVARLASTSLTELSFGCGGPGHKASVHSGEGSSAAIACVLRGCPRLQALRLSHPWGDILQWSSRSLTKLTCAAVASRYFRDLLNADLPTLGLICVEEQLTVLGIFSLPEANALAQSLEKRLEDPSKQTLYLDIHGIKVDSLRSLGFPAIQASALKQAFAPLAKRPAQARVGGLAYQGVAFASVAEEVELAAMFPSKK
uniref:Uncharacterized protein n=1 Tax=Dunaliella tertiolecta TaxID=3047 RepID=A0A7S3QM43_DUNTE